MINPNNLLEILNKKWERVTMIERFTLENYQTYIDALSEQVKKVGGMVLDVEEIYKKTFMEKLFLKDEIERKNLLFVYNLDLFGNNTDPDLATNTMAFLRKTYHKADKKTIMFAKPNANLDYNSREGYTYADNHPIGNWCVFYRIDEDLLKKHGYPYTIRVREINKFRKK
jgi:hypothetical protein